MSTQTIIKPETLPMHTKLPKRPRKRSKKKSSDFRGVSQCKKDGRWQARIRVGRAVKYLGRFRTEKEAALRYDEAARHFHGQKAVVNFTLCEAKIIANQMKHEMKETEAEPRPDRESFSIKRRKKILNKTTLGNEPLIHPLVSISSKENFPIKPMRPNHIISENDDTNKRIDANLHAVHSVSNISTELHCAARLLFMMSGNQLQTAF